MSAPDLTGYRTVHLALRGGAELLASVAATVPASHRARVGAFRRYWAGYAREVLTHHTTEDEIMFPALVARVPMAADLIARTDAEHHELDALMERCGAAVDALAAGMRTDDLAPAFRALADHMNHHLDFEDEDILPLYERHWTAEEYAALDEAAMKALGIRNALFAVPFVLHFTSPDVRAQMLGHAPLPLRIIDRIGRRPHARLLAELGLPSGPATTPAVA
jgi:hypothetical protein